jgi:AcrR family transcriptional regulator
MMGTHESRLRVFYAKHFKTPPKQARSRSVVDAIVTAALERFGKVDFALTDIAARAGVGVSSIYDYFASRDDLYAGVLAKATENHLAAFEQLLEANSRASLSQLFVNLFDKGIDIYVKDPRMPRAAMRIAHSLELMPMLIASRHLSAAALARMLRNRNDVRDLDLDAASTVIAHAGMGVMMAMMWQKEEAIPHEDLRAAWTAMFTTFVAKSATPEKEAEHE